MPKFFVKNDQIQEEKIKIIGEDVNHIVNVLRLREKDEINICNKDKEVTYRTEIVEIGKEHVYCSILETVIEKVESNVKVTIFQGLPKSDKMEYIIQKTTELGGTEIIPVAMKRCIAKLEGKDETKKIARWQKIAEVAAKQSGRDKIPHVGEIMKFAQIKNIIPKFDLFIVAYEEEKELSLKKVLREEHTRRLKANMDEINNNQKDDKSDYFGEEIELTVGVVIGPEGGIDKQEIEELKMNGAKVITLGNRILRTETAPLSILSNIMYEFEK